MVKGVVIGLLLGVPIGAIAVAALVPGLCGGARTAGLGASATGTHRVAHDTTDDGVGTAPTLQGRRDPVEPSEGSTSPSSVAARREALSQALKGKDWSAYKKVLYALGKANTPEADRLLVEVLGNEEVVFPEGMREHYEEWLEGSAVDGLVAAIWQRIEIDVETYGAPRESAIRAWAKLLGRYGSRQDLDRLLREGNEEAHRIGLQAYLKSGRPEVLSVARQILERRHEPGGSGPYGLDALSAARAVLSADFDEGVALLDTELGSVRDRRPSTIPTASVLRFYAHHLPLDRLEEGKSWLLARFRDLEKGTIGYPIRGLLHAVAILRGRGLDVSGLEAIGHWGPQTIKAIVATGGPAKADDQRWSAALSAIQLDDFNQVPLESRIAALEAALPYLPKQDQVQRLLQRLRVRLLWTNDD